MARKVLMMAVALAAVLSHGAAFTDTETKGTAYNDPKAKGAASTDPKIKNETSDTDAEERGRLLVAVARTLVTSSALTITVTSPTTCVTTVDTGTTCARRRRHMRNRKLVLRGLEPEKDMQMDTSLRMPEVSVLSPFKEFPVNGFDRSGRIILWSSLTTTITITSTSFDTGTTVPVSFSCTFNDLSTIAMCPAG